MSYGLETIPNGGKIHKPATAEVVRPIEVDDLQYLVHGNKDAKPRSERTPLRMLSQRHRNLARLIGGGMALNDAAAITGYAPGTVSHLVTDPSMLNLIRHYSEEKDLAHIEANEKMGQLASTVIDVLQSRLEDPEHVAKMTDGQLLQVLEVSADRSGLGPTTKSEVQVNVDFATRLEAARRRVKELRTIDVRAEEVK
jgi:hypothetical protein